MGRLAERNTIMADGVFDQVGPSNFENPQLGLAMDAMDAITPLWDNDVKMTPEFPQMLVTGM